MINFLNSIIQKFFKNFKNTLLILNLHSIPLAYSSKLNTKTNSSIFNNIFTYTSTTAQSLLSLQKIQYLGLHIVSAAR